MKAKTKPINTKAIGAPVKRKKNGQWAKGTPPPNPDGAPKRGQSWAEVIKEIAELTPDEARKLSAEIFSKIDIHDPITLKQAVVMRVYAAMLFDPQPGLIKEFIDRADGKLRQPIDVSLSDELRRLLAGVPVDEQSKVKADLIEIFGQDVVVSDEVTG